MISLKINKKSSTKKQIDNPNKGVVLTLMLFIIFTLFIVGTTISWESLISKFTAFSDFNKWLSDIKVGGYQIFNNIIGAPVVLDEATGSTTGVINALGSWTITDVSIFLFIITGIIGLCSKIKFNEFIETITSSIKKILPIAITVMLVSIVLVLTVTTGINVTIANFILGITNGFNIVTSTITTVICSVLSSDFYYFLTTAGYAFTANVTNTEYYGVIAFIIQSIYYLTMVIAPTSAILVAGLYYLNIPYNKWIKYIWKVLLTLFVIVLIAAIILFVLI